MRIISLSAYVLLGILIHTSCSSAPKGIDWEAVPLLFTPEILNSDFHELVTELELLDRIGSDKWKFDPEEPRYIAASQTMFYLFDRYSGTLFSIGLREKRAAEILTVQKGEESYIIGLDVANNENVLLYSQEKFYKNGKAEPVFNIASAASAALTGDSIIAVNNPRYSEIDGRYIVELNRSGKLTRRLWEFSSVAGEAEEKSSFQVRAHGKHLAIWKVDHPEIILLDTESGEERNIYLDHIILEKRELINTGKYFKDLEGRVTAMFMPVFADMDFKESGLFALLSNDGLGVIIQFSLSGEIENIFTFPLLGTAVALDLAVQKSGEALRFGVIVARGQRLSAYFYQAPATHE